MDVQQQWRAREKIALDSLGLAKGTVFTTSVPGITVHAKTGSDSYMEMLTLEFETPLQVIRGPEYNEGGILDIIARDLKTSRIYLIDVMQLDHRALPGTPEPHWR